MSETTSLLNESAETRDPQQIREMFDRLAGRYDLANHLLSFGFDFSWRRAACRIVARNDPRRLADLATGSGDLALALQRHLPRCDITGVDFSGKMLARASRKGVRKLIQADALQLPFSDRSFDQVTVAFGLRNMEDWGAALREMRRILVPLGNVLVLDFSIPRFPLFRAVYQVYLHQVLPRLCRLITSEADAYSYLGATIEAFPSGQTFCDLMTESGFANATAQTLTGGIVTIYTARVPG